MELSNVQAIKAFFEQGGGRKVEMLEMKNLTAAERDELGRLCNEALAKQRAA